MIIHILIHYYDIIHYYVNVILMEELFIEVILHDEELIILHDAIIIHVDDILYLIISYFIHEDYVVINEMLQ